MFKLHQKYKNKVAGNGQVVRKIECDEDVHKISKSYLFYIQNDMINFWLDKAALIYELLLISLGFLFGC